MVDLGEITKLILSRAKCDDFGRFHHVLDHGRLAAHRALSQIVQVLIDPDQRHRPVNLFQNSVLHVSGECNGQLTTRQNAICNQLWLRSSTCPAQGPQAKMHLVGPPRQLSGESRIPSLT